MNAAFVYSNALGQVSLYSRRVMEVEPFIEEWPFAVEFSSEDQLQKAEEVGSKKSVRSRAAAGHGQSSSRENDSKTVKKESLTVFSSKMLNVNLIEAQLSRCIAIVQCSQTVPPTVANLFGCLYIFTS